MVGGGGGTNNDSDSDPKFKDDICRGFECFDEGDTHYRSATPLSHLTSKEKGRGRWKLAAS